VRYLQRLARTARVDRESFLAATVEGRRVLHLGCVDSGLLDQRLSAQTLLHGRLAKAAGEIWGLDLDRSGVERLREIGFARVFTGSAEQPPKEIPEGYFEVVVAGEIIEHVRNAGQFLDAAARLLAPEGELIITTPNALRFYNSVPAIMRREFIHPDHLSWYTPHTLCTAAEASALEVHRLLVYDNIPRARMTGVRNPAAWVVRGLCNASITILHASLVRLFPYLSDGLILVCRRNSVVDRQ
jgi:2-polyprenyl-3-methyl-5-hydroxy-6-metoxy-1,4-benzoquinol methylase